MLGPGDPAPDFYLPSVEDSAAEYMLSAAADTTPVVLAFVPTAQTGSLLETLGDIEWAALVDRITVFGIGRDLSERLASGLPFPVLADDSGYVTDLYGVEGRSRALVVVDRQCTIQFSWQATSPDASPPLDRLRSVVSELPR